MSGGAVRNAEDAARLVMGLAASLHIPGDRSSSGMDAHRLLAKNAFDELLRLCAGDMAGSSLARLAGSGLRRSLTPPDEFTGVLEDRGSFLHSRFVLLIRRVAAFNMSSDDFLLRCVAGPVLAAADAGGDDNGDRDAVGGEERHMWLLDYHCDTCQMSSRYCQFHPGFELWHVPRVNASWQ